METSNSSHHWLKPHVSYVLQECNSWNMTSSVTSNLSVRAIGWVDKIVHGVESWVHYFSDETASQYWQIWCYKMKDDLIFFNVLCILEQCRLVIFILITKVVFSLNRGYIISVPCCKNQQPEEWCLHKLNSFFQFCNFTHGNPVVALNGLPSKRKIRCFTSSSHWAM